MYLHQLRVGWSLRIKRPRTWWFDTTGNTSTRKASCCNCINTTATEILYSFFLSEVVFLCTAAMFVHSLPIKSTIRLARDTIRRHSCSWYMIRLSDLLRLKAWVGKLLPLVVLYPITCIAAPSFLWPSSQLPLHTFPYLPLGFWGSQSPESSLKTCRAFSDGTQPSTCTDRPLQPSTCTDRPLQPSTCTDLPLQPSTCTDRPLQPSTCTDLPLPLRQKPSLDPFRSNLIIFRYALTSRRFSASSPRLQQVD